LAVAFILWRSRALAENQLALVLSCGQLSQAQRIISAGGSRMGEEYSSCCSDEDQSKQRARINRLYEFHLNGGLEISRQY